MPILTWKDEQDRFMAGGSSLVSVPEILKLKGLVLNVDIYPMPRLWLCAPVLIRLKELGQLLWQTLPCFHFFVDGILQMGNCLAVHGDLEVDRLADPYVIKTVAFHFPQFFDVREVNLMDLMGSLPELMARNKEVIKHGTESS